MEKIQEKFNSEVKGALLSKNLCARMRNMTWIVTMYGTIQRSSSGHRIKTRNILDSSLQPFRVLSIFWKSFFLLPCARTLVVDRTVAFLYTAPAVFQLPITVQSALHDLILRPKTKKWPDSFVGLKFGAYIFIATFCVARLHTLTET